MLLWSDNEGEVWIDNLALTPKASDSISNTSFEEIATVPNWTISGSGKKQMAVSQGDVNSGNGALYIKDDSNDAVNILSDAVTVDSGWIGHEMKLTYAIKGFGTPDANGMVNNTVPSVFIQFFDKDNKQIGRITAIGSYTRWTQRTATGTVPVGATSFKVWIAYGTSTVGDVLIDDITVTMVCDHNSLTYTATVPASCQAPGKENAYCALCRKTIERDITALEHDWDDGVVKTPASCELTGVKTYTCANCLSTRVDDYPATGHSLLAVPAKAATATEDGNIAYWVCKTCGKYYADPDENEEIYDKNSVIIPSTNGSESNSDALAPDDTGDSTALVLMIALMAITATAVITAKSRLVLR